jgi:putative Ca2+/H+ antiporter (TMEM165/GDT1 family)
MFAFGAVYAWRESTKAKDEQSVEVQPKHGVVVTAFIVIFLAEWGDLTQILTANLAAKYGSPLSVGVGALLALFAVAAIAVVSGQALLRFVDIATIRKVTAVVLLGLAAFSLWTAVR